MELICSGLNTTARRGATITISLASRDLIRPFGAPSPKEKGKYFWKVLNFALLLWRSCRKATDEVLSLPSPPGHTLNFFAHQTFHHVWQIIIEPILQHAAQ